MGQFLSIHYTNGRFFLRQVHKWVENFEPTISMGRILYHLLTIEMGRFLYPLAAHMYPILYSSTTPPDANANAGY